MPTKVIHSNNGKCEKCAQIFAQWKDFNKELKDWFIALQAKIPSCHIAYAGRGKAEQDEFFKKGTSKAKWGESPHNYGLAIDVFELTVSGARWDKAWYKDRINPEVKKTDWLEHGLDWAKFPDAPHIQLKAWKELVKSGEVKLVE